MKSVRIEAVDGEPAIEVVGYLDGERKMLHTVESDETPEQILQDVAEAVCEFAEIEFEGWA